jgi:hypothetical protein
MEDSATVESEVARKETRHPVCPFCREMVDPAAEVCPACGREMEPVLALNPLSRKALWAFICGGLPALFVLLTLIVLTVDALQRSESERADVVFGGGSPAVQFAGVMGTLMGFVGLPCALVAVPLGHIARSNIRRSRGRLVGAKLALTGLVCAYAVLGLLLVLVVGAIVWRQTREPARPAPVTMLQASEVSQG